MPPTTHSSRGASSAGRWVHCPGSCRLLKDIPKKDSIYALAGTAQHYVAEKCLREDKNAAYFQGREIVVDRMDGGLEKIMFTEDMVNAVQLYLDVVRQDAADNPAAKLSVEQCFELGWVHPDLFGTNDACLAVPFGRLRIYDYKGGRTPVNPEGNPQLMYYALGAVGEGNPNDYEDAELIIVQPFGEGASVKRWVVTVEELMRWKDEVLLPAVLATYVPDAPCIAGPWCEKHFCDARPVCPTLAAKASEIAQGMFSPVPAARPKVLPAPEALRPDQIVAILDHGDMVTGWIEEVRGYAVRQAMAGHDVTSGRYKVVRGRTNRKLTDKAEAQLTRYLQAQAYDKPKLVGVTEAEKRLAKLGWEKPKIKEFMEGITERPEGKLTLAPSSDSRPAVSTGHNFTAVTESTENNEMADWL